VRSLNFFIRHTAVPVVTALETTFFMVIHSFLQLQYIQYVGHSMSLPRQ